MYSVDAGKAWLADNSLEIIWDRPSVFPKTSTLKTVCFFQQIYIHKHLLWQRGFHFYPLSRKLQGEFHTLYFLHVQSEPVPWFVKYIFYLSFCSTYTLSFPHTVGHTANTAIREQAFIITVLSLMACAIIRTQAHAHSFSLVLLFFPCVWVDSSPKYQANMSIENR